MSSIVVYSSSATSSLKIKKDIEGTKRLLDSKQLAYEERDMAQLDKADRDQVYEVAGTRTIPLVFVDGRYVGDYDELQYREETETLDAILRGQF
ncbi:glutaredoxin [Streptomyces sp. NPDC001941]|uniref:glutaredoxin family protein n=1 Tax=Streptomyces sp. NPDC001941 TaxID=3154659 RepID=UPI003319BBC0